MRALVFGHYGGRNFGDELMLVGLVRLLKRAEGCAIRLQTPDGLVALGLQAQGVEAAYSKSPMQILQGIWWADTVVLGGGTIFHDAYPDERYRGYWRNLLALSLIFALARMLGRRVSLLGIGVGPLRRRRTRAFTALLKLAANDISVRDRTSYDDLASLPGNQAKVRITDDLSALAPLSPVGPVVGRVVGISLVPPEVVSGATPDDVGVFHERLAQWLRDGLDGGALDGVMLISANVGRDSDLAVSARMQERIGGDRVEHLVFDGDPLAFAQQIGRCSLIVAARYHVAVAAHRMGGPTLWLAYQRKVRDAALSRGVAASDLFALADVSASERSRDALFARMHRSMPSRLGGQQRVEGGQGDQQVVDY